MPGDIFVPVVGDNTYIFNHFEVYMTGCTDDTVSEQWELSQEM